MVAVGCTRGCEGKKANTALCTTHAPPQMCLYSSRWLSNRIQTDPAHFDLLLSLNDSQKVAGELKFKKTNEEKKIHPK